MRPVTPNSPSPGHQIVCPGLRGHAPGLLIGVESSRKGTEANQLSIRESSKTLGCEDHGGEFSVSSSLNSRAIDHPLIGRPNNIMVSPKNWLYLSFVAGVPACSFRVLPERS